MTENLEKKYKDCEDFTEEDALNIKEHKEEENKKVKLTWKEKVNLLKNITVEPSLWLFVVAVIISMITTQNLSLEKACRVNLAYSDEICHSLKKQEVGSQNEYEKETQKLLGTALSWKTYISATIPCVIALCAGSFSDKTGYRKFFMIISIFGQLLASFTNIWHVFFLNQIGLEYLMLTEALFEGLSGGWCLCFSSAFSLISSITTEETRTFRMGVVNFCVTMGFPIGMSLSGILLNKTGYYGCYGLVTGMHVVNLLYVMFLVKDPPRTIEQKKHDGKGLKHYLKEFFDLANAKGTFSVIWKDAPNQRRLRLCTLVVIVCVLFGPMFGEVSILYMMTRYRFNWNEVKFSVFQTYNFALHTIGTVFSIVVFCRRLQWHDSLLGIISTMSKILASFVYCFAPNEKIFFLAPLVDLLNGTSLLAIRSIFTKLVEPNELGKVNAVMGLAENLMPLIYVPMYVKMYTSTMEVLPGAVFLMGAAMTLPAVIVFSWLFYDHRKQARKLKSQSVE